MQIRATFGATFPFQTTVLYLAYKPFKFQWEYILTAFKNATPSLTVDIVWMKISMIVNLSVSYSAEWYHCSVSPVNAICNWTN